MCSMLAAVPNDMHPCQAYSGEANEQHKWRERHAAQKKWKMLKSVCNNGLFHSNVLLLFASRLKFTHLDVHVGSFHSMFSFCFPLLLVCHQESVRCQDCSTVRCQDCSTGVSNVFLSVLMTPANNVPTISGKNATKACATKMSLGDLAMSHITAGPAKARK